MLQKLRRSIQGTLAYVVIAIIAVPLAAFGIDWLFGGPTETSAAFDVNGEPVSYRELDLHAELIKRRLLQRAGPDANVDQIDTKLVRDAATRELISASVLLQAANDFDIAVSNRDVNGHILEVPEFQVDGVFSQTIFERTLRDSGYSPAAYKQQVERQLIQAQLASVFVDTGFVTPDELELAVRITNQKRSFSYVTLGVGELMQSIDVTQEEARARYDSTPEGYMSEEMVALDYIELKLEDFYRPVDDAALEELYQEYVQALGERRRASHILIELDDDTDTERAREILLDVKKQFDEGADFGELAATYSEDIGTSGNRGLLGVSDGDTFPPAFEEALTGLGQGEVSDPVETEFGLHLIKRMEVEVRPYEEMADILREEHQSRLAVPAFSEAIERLGELAAESPDLAAPAAEMELEVVSAEPFSRNLSAGLLAVPAVVQEAFSDPVLKEGFNSEMIEVGDEHYVVLRVREHFPPARKEFSEVEEEIRIALVTERAEARADELAKEFLAKVRASTGELEKQRQFFAGLAAEQSLKLVSKEDVKRSDLEVDGRLLRFVFLMPRPNGESLSVGAVRLESGDQVVALLTGVTDGQLDELDADQRTSLVELLSQNSGDTEFAAFRNKLMREVEVNFN